MTLKKFNHSQQNLLYVTLLFSLLGTTLSCAKKAEDTVADIISSGGSSRYLYLATGACYSGSGLTTFTNTSATNKIYRINLSTGAQQEAKIADYTDSKSQAGDTPVSIASADANNIYVLVQNATAGLKRIDKIPKENDPFRTLVTNNATIFSANSKFLSKTSNGDLLVSKTSAIERVSGADYSRIQAGANPYVSAPAAPCATSTTLISSLGTLSNQMIYFAHAAASQNRIGFVKAAGYAAAGDCPVAQSAPNANAFPTAMAYDQANEILLVAYANSSAVTADVNSIYAYKLTVTSNSVAIASSNKIYDFTLYPATYGFQLFGISAMALDTSTNQLYVSTAISTAATVANYRVERLTYDPTKVGVANTSVLTKSSSSYFLSHGADTKCIADMMIDN